MGFRVGMYCSDNGELKSNEMASWLASRGITHQYTAPHTSVHIGQVEHMHQTFMEKVQTMWIYAKISSFLLDELYLTSSHLHAKTTTHLLQGKTPWELWFGRRPDYSYMQEIGCQAFILISNKHNLKVYEWSVECILIGYDAKSKCYRCYDCAVRQVYSLYHICFLGSHDSHPLSGNAV